MKYSNGRRPIEITVDGRGVATHVGALLLREVADKTGLTRGFSEAMWPVRQRQSAHDPGWVLCDLAVMLGDGGDCVSDLAIQRKQPGIFGNVASTSTAWRVLRHQAPQRLSGLRAARARARGRAWALGAAPVGDLTLDFDATLVDSHSDKECAEATWKKGFGFHPLMVYLDETGEPLAGILRPGGAGSDTAADHINALNLALEQIPPSYRRERTILARADSGGASHDFANALRKAGVRFSLGFPLRPEVKEAIWATPESDWVVALTQECGEADHAHVCELKSLDLSAWPEGTRAICRREPRHPGARQKALPGLEQYRFVVCITDQEGDDTRLLEVCHRRRAHVEDGIRCGKDSGLRGFPSWWFDFNRVWLELVITGQCLVRWAQLMCLTGQARWWEPKTLRHRLFHVAGRLVRTGRRSVLRLQESWPWAEDLCRAFVRLRTMPAAP